MSVTVEQVEQVLRTTGEALKADLWRPEDAGFLAARAKDLFGLNAKAAAATDEAKQKAYSAAARDVVNHVKVVAIQRMETAVKHIVDALGAFFLEKVLPELMKLLPKLVLLVL